MKISPLGMSIGGTVAMLIDLFSGLLVCDFNNENLGIKNLDNKGYLYFEKYWEFFKTAMRIDSKCSHQKK